MSVSDIPPLIEGAHPYPSAAGNAFELAKEIVVNYGFSMTEGYFTFTVAAFVNNISFVILGVALTPETAANRTQPSHTGVQQLMSSLPPTDSQCVPSIS